ncbi:hypothetical protein FQN50_003057 [Emmonsiellopsis sp. PD_5]|nr:hypothetical protein FQN50_003057 [Emmonsiellopsis sp. PD_5]
MARFAPLGNLGKLPLELRRMVWENLAPVRKETAGDPAEKTDLSILRASKILYREVFDTIYSHPVLEFDVSPFDPPNEKLVSAFFKRGYNQELIQDNERPEWVLRSLEEALQHGFGSLPWSKFEAVVVNFPAPDPDDGGQIFREWQKACDLVRLFRKADVINKLVIRLRKGKKTDWVRSWRYNGYKGLLTRSLQYYRSTCESDYDAVVLPFCLLQNIRDLVVEPHSPELREAMDWTVIDYALSTARSARDGKGTSRKDIKKMEIIHHLSMYGSVLEKLRGRIVFEIRRDLCRYWRHDTGTGLSQYDMDMVADGGGKLWDPVIDTFLEPLIKITHFASPLRPRRATFIPSIVVQRRLLMILTEAILFVDWLPELNKFDYLHLFGVEEYPKEGYHSISFSEIKFPPMGVESPLEKSELLSCWQRLLSDPNNQPYFRDLWENHVRNS